MNPNPDTPQGPKYVINIEGTEYSWDSPTITAAQIRELASLPDDQQLQEVDLDSNTERTVAEDEVVRLKPGHGFAKKVKFQRG